MPRVIPDWYHHPMAMTLRLDDELDARLTAVAEQLQRSKQQLVSSAVEDYLERLLHEERVRGAVDRVIAENEGLLRRLAAT